jgi:hypothetical protein
MNRRDENRILSNEVEAKFFRLAARQRHFHSGQTGDDAKYSIFSRMRVGGEGTTGSFSTVLATRVLENSASPLALSQNHLLFFVGLRALA